MSIGERIKSARKNCGLSQIELAKAVGRSQSAVAEWETGDTEPRRNIVEKIAAALGVSALWLEVGGFDEDGREPYDGPPAAHKNPESDASNLIPVYAAHPLVSDAGSFALGDVVEYRPCPNGWKNVKGLYGVYVADDAMAPRINAGELAWVHPHRRPAPGQEAIFLTDGADNARAMLRILVGHTATKWVVRHVKTQQESDLKKTDWDCQLIVGVDWNR